MSFRASEVPPLKQVASPSPTQADTDEPVNLLDFFQGAALLESRYLPLAQTADLCVGSIPESRSMRHRSNPKPLKRSTEFTY